MSAWHQQALCREIGADAFFLPDDDTAGVSFLSIYNAAKAVCVRCPVRPACLEDAMAREGHSDRHNRAGIWGGLTPNQRAALAACRRKEAAA
jgi:hypothetical protein